jgi:hypothetical protein
MQFPAFSQGSLTPPGAPAPTMKTLTQIEPRTDVLTLSGNGNNQYIISQSGSYYLTTNITGVASKNAISIQADDVVLDLNGFTLFGVASSQMGISVNGTHVDLVIRNGSVNGWGGNGIGAAGVSASTFENLHSYGNTAVGIKVGSRDILKNCVVVTNGNDGIDTGANCALANCLVASNYITGISTGNYCNVRDCTANFNQSGISTGDGCVVAQCVMASNTYYQVLEGNNCSLDGCTASGGSDAAVSALNNCSIKNCTQSGTPSEGIEVGTNCTIIGCTATGDGGYGFYTGDGCTIKDCTGNKDYYGFVTGNSCNITGCAANDNLVGFGPGNSCTIHDCLFTANETGLQVEASSLVKNNNSSSNSFVGISLYGNNNRIEGNISSFDGIGLYVPNPENIIYQNTVTAATSTAYDIGSGNMVGVIVAAPTSGTINGSSGGTGLGTTSPWANFSF